jgi:hypothetical protein
MKIGAAKREATKEFDRINNGARDLDEIFS